MNLYVLVVVQDWPSPSTGCEKLTVALSGRFRIAKDSGNDLNANEMPEFLNCFII